MRGINSSWMFWKKTPIASENPANVDGALDSKIDKAHARVKPGACQESLPDVNKKKPNYSNTSENAEAVTLCALPFMRSKKSAAPVISEDFYSTTASLSDSSKDTFEEEKIDLEDKFKDLSSISEKGHKIILKRGETLNSLIKETQGAIGKATQEVNSSKKHRLSSREFYEIESKKEELTKLEEKLGLLQKLSSLQSEFSRYEQTVAEEVFPFEINSKDLEEEIASIDHVLQNTFDPKSRVDKANHSFLALKKETLKEKRENLLEGCIHLKKETELDMDRLNRKTKSVDIEHKDFHSAFTTVYQDFLQAKKHNLEQKSNRLDSTIQALQQDLKKDPPDSKKVERLRAVFNNDWNFLCAALHNLPKDQKKLLLNQIVRQNYDPEIKKTFKDLLISGQSENQIESEDLISLFEQIRLALPKF